ncbi:SafA/ExsA family spore coat assembly protein, partial [Peribacillus psychrosaccharolyticus]
MKIHIVQKGDTLWKVSKKYGVSFEELKQLNSQLSNPDMMMPGMKIKIPGTSGNVKKESVANQGAVINYGVKEAPIQQPMQQPMQQLVKEAPIVQQPVKEKPIVKEQIIVKEKPIVKEMPMPKPVAPEIDINNYYMVNMTKNMNIQKPVKEAPKPVQKPIIPPPMPKIPPIPVLEESPEEEITIIQEQQQEIIVPEQEYIAPEQECVPITPIMAGSGYCEPIPPWAFGHVQSAGISPQAVWPSPAMQEVPCENEFNPYQQAQTYQQGQQYQQPQYYQSEQSYQAPSYQPMQSTAQYQMDESSSSSSSSGKNYGLYSQMGQQQMPGYYQQTQMPQAQMPQYGQAESSSESSGLGMHYYQQAMAQLPLTQGYYGKQPQQESSDCGCGKKTPKGPQPSYAMKMKPGNQSYYPQQGNLHGNFTEVEYESVDIMTNPVYGGKGQPGYGQQGTQYGQQAGTQQGMQNDGQQPGTQQGTQYGQQPG